MEKREVLLPKELIEEIAGIVEKENYTVLKEAFSDPHAPSLKLDWEEAEALINLAVIEKRKAWLKFPYHDEDHPKHDERHEEAYDDVQMGIYEKTLYYVESAFREKDFEGLL